VSQTKRLSCAQRNLVVELGARRATRTGLKFYNRAVLESLDQRGLVKTEFNAAGVREYSLTVEGLAVHRELTTIKPVVSIGEYVDGQMAALAEEEREREEEQAQRAARRQR